MCVCVCVGGGGFSHIARSWQSSISIYLSIYLSIYVCIRACLKLRYRCHGPALFDFSLHLEIIDLYIPVSSSCLKWCPTLRGLHSPEVRKHCQIISPVISGNRLLRQTRRAAGSSHTIHVQRTCRDADSNGPPVNQQSREHPLYSLVASTAAATTTTTTKNRKRDKELELELENFILQGL